MIRLSPTAARLDGAAAWARDLLVDLARLVPVDAPHPDVVELDVPEREPDAASSLAALAARGWDIAVDGARVLVPRATLAAVARVASAADEQASTAADRFGRVPSGDNLLVREGLEREPLLHAAAAALRHAVVRASAGRPVWLIAPWPDGRRWAAAFTHDLDVVAGWPAFAALRWMELFRARELALLGRAVGAAARAVGRDVPRQGVEAVLSIEAGAGVRSTWFVLCGTPTFASFRRGDLTYTPESPAARRILRAIRAGGHEVGLHGSFATLDDDARFATERARLADVAGAPVTGVRQHFLRMRAPRTQRAMHAAGFSYDATLGYPDRNGFRIGAADVVHQLWSASDDRAVPLDLVPLTWMDRALSKYRGVQSPDAWIDDALSLAARCESVEGLWTALWHPNLTDALGYPGALAGYARLVGEIVARRAYVAPVAELVRWRAARRAVRLSAPPDEQRAREGVDVVGHLVPFELAS